jgi:hypothetical protein
MTVTPLTLVVHGASGVGKSWLGDTAPAPRLILDAEGGTKWTPSNKAFWNPTKGEKPPMDADETTVVTVKDFATLGMVYQWLQSGQHPFKSVVMDSLTEIQKRCLDNVSGTEAMTQQGWGEVLRKMEGLVRSYRDLTMNNGKSLHNVTFLCGSQLKDGELRPHLQGQLGLTLPYYVDVVGYLHVAQDADGGIAREMLVTPVQGFSAKDRTGRLGFKLTNPSISGMVDALNA